jgi:hypothetical protein
LTCKLKRLKKQAEEADKLFKKAMDDAEFGVAGQGTVASGLSDAISQLKARSKSQSSLQLIRLLAAQMQSAMLLALHFQDIASGAKSTQEALADAFESIGKAFISMAAEIIAKQMTLIILQTIFNALSGGGGGALGTANKNLSAALVRSRPQFLGSL